MVESSDNKQKRDYYINGYSLYLKDINKIQYLSLEEEQELFRRYHSGDMEAKKRIIEANLQCVIHYVIKYRNEFIDVNELVQEGNLGLLKAIETFDPNKGYPFRIYAGKSVRQFILDEIARHTTLCKPDYARRVLFKFNKKVEELTKELQHEPTIYEISEKLNIPYNKVEKYLLLQQIPQDLDSVIEYVDETEVGDSFIDYDADLDERKRLEDLPDDIAYILDNTDLSPLERKIVYYSFGFDGKGEKNNAEVGRILGMHRESIRKRLNKILSKLRNNLGMIGYDEFENKYRK
jgi:RNA polymerase primary sigma factor